MGELSITVERVAFGIHLLRCAGDLDCAGSAQVARLVENIPGLVHAVVDLGNVRSYADHALDPFHDERITVIGVSAHLALLPGRVAGELAGLRSARDIDDALVRLQRDQALAAAALPVSVIRPAVPYPRDGRHERTNADAPR